MISSHCFVHTLENAGTVLACTLWGDRRTINTNTTRSGLLVDTICVQYWANADAKPVRLLAVAPTLPAAINAFNDIRAKEEACEPCIYGKAICVFSVTACWEESPYHHLYKALLALTQHRQKHTKIDKSPDTRKRQKQTKQKNQTDLGSTRDKTSIQKQRQKKSYFASGRFLCAF